MRAIGTQALAEAQMRLRGKSRKQVRMAMVADCVKALQLVARNGSQGKALGTFLRMYFGRHEMFQPGKHEKGNGATGPRPAKFVYSAETEPPAPVPSPDPPPAPGTLLANGQGFTASRPDHSSAMSCTWLSPTVIGSRSHLTGFSPMRLAVQQAR